MDSTGSDADSWVEADTFCLLGEITSERSSISSFGDSQKSACLCTFEFSSEEFEPRLSGIPILDLRMTEDHLKDARSYSNEMTQMDDIVKVMTSALRRHRGTSLKGNIASKFIDCLKKKPLKLCRNLLRKAVAGTLPNKFKHFTLLKKDKQVLEQIINSEYWPTSERPVDLTRKYKSFSYQCICDLLTEGDFKQLYDEVIDWYFNTSSPKELEKFIGLSKITPEEIKAFQVFFKQGIREKCKSTTI